MWMIWACGELSSSADTETDIFKIGHREHGVAFAPPQNRDNRSHKAPLVIQTISGA